MKIRNEERKHIMNHEAFESQMIDTVNRHAEEKRGQAERVTRVRKVISKKDASA